MKIEFNLTDDEIEMLDYIAEDTKVLFNSFFNDEQKYSLLCAQIIKGFIKTYIVDEYKKANK